MSRVKTANGLQAKFLNSVCATMNSDWKEVSKIAKVSNRTLFDWRREKYTMPYKTLRRLNKISKVEIPQMIEILPDYWNVRKAGSIGAIKRYQLYGNPGTIEGRTAGGRTSQSRFSRNPEYAKKVGFKIRNLISHPKNTESFAEFIGIVLGDGSITNQQVAISLNSKTEIAYGEFVKNLTYDLFGMLPHMTTRERNTLQIVVTGRNLVDFLLKKGLKIGDKVKQQVDVPNWIFKDNKLAKGCLRGLVDTDGGVYFHSHVTKGIKYRHMGLCFTSYSRPLLLFVYNTLVKFNISAKVYKNGRVFVYDRRHIKRYFDVIGSHNSYHIERFTSYKGSKV